MPDPQAPSTVEASVLDWAEPLQPAHARMLAWYRDLIVLRRRLRLGERALWPELRDTGDVIVLTVPARTGRDDPELIVAIDLTRADGRRRTDLAGLVPNTDELDLALSWLGTPARGELLRSADTIALIRPV